MTNENDIKNMCAIGAYPNEDNCEGAGFCYQCTHSSINIEGDE